MDDDSVTVDEEIAIMLSKLSPQDYLTFSSYSCGNDGGSNSFFFHRILKHYAYIKTNNNNFLISIFFKKYI